jgi:hypothetical protein
MPGAPFWRFVGVITTTIKGHHPREAVAGSENTSRVPTADLIVNAVTNAGENLRPATCNGHR